MRTASLALLGLTVLRLLAAAVLPLAPDEAYYWVWGRTLQAGYLDHPPMVAWWIAAGTALLGDTPLGIRLLGPPGVAIASVALADAADRLFPDRRPGVAAAVAFNAMPVTNAGAVLMTPDTPLVVFWCLGFWALARLHASGTAPWWGLVGLFAGAALASKYTAALLGVGIVLWLALEPSARRWWHGPWLYAGGAIAAAVFAPVVAWNALHGWASFVKQGGRAGAGEGATLRFLGELIGGQALLASPVLLVLGAIGVGFAAVAWARRRDGGAGLVAALVIPGALLFLWQATGSRVQGNWPAILYPAAVVAAAAFVAGAWVRLGAGVGLVLTAAVALQALAAPVTLPRRFDPTLARLAGWESLAAEVDAARQATGADFVGAEEYGLAAQMAFHLPRGVRVVASGDRWALFDRPEPPAGLTGLLLQSSRRGAGDLGWPGAEPVGEVSRARDGEVAERYRVLRARTPAGNAPVAELPRPR